MTKLNGKIQSRTDTDIYYRANIWTHMKNNSQDHKKNNSYLNAILYKNININKII